ncbi:MAG: phosphoribosyl transferase [Betaproteobacteria bacterium HGW-Betaproteobacteria-11]|nr:MAG: phosphoribosyl transferase [Betaproteobacteria bacterium HGW-Betaproteobacteria-11]
MFRDRMEAARRLAERLAGYRGKQPLVLAIPRGAVPMAKIVAEMLEGEFDVVLVRKLRAPSNPEFAIGAIDESGWSFIAEHAAAAGAGADYLAAEQRTQLETLRRRRAEYTPLRPPLDPAGRIVIVIDDGLATGATMIAALHGLRARNPARLVCAVPVSPPETLEKVASLADEVICLETPENFQAVGQFYQDFAQVDDEQVREMLRVAQR